MKIKLAVVMPNMKQGGAEKVITMLLNNLDSEKFDLNLILLQKKGEFLEQLNENIKVVALNIQHARFSIFKILKVVKDINPDILFSSLSYLSLYIGIFKFMFPKNIKFIARESSILSSIHNKGLYKFLYKYFYNKFDFIIAQSEFMKLDLITFAHLKEKKIKIIRNPIDLEQIKKLSEEKIDNLELDKNYLIFIGRLSKEKQIDEQLKAMKYLNNFYLLVIGDGQLRDYLEKLAIRLGVDDRVVFLGYQKNPYKFIKNAKFLVMTSKYEGYPNVAIEAMSLGVPVISYNFPGGLKDIIIDKYNGLIVKKSTVENFIETLLDNNINFDKKNIIYSIEHHKMEVVIKEYNDLFNKVCSC